jgi:hypothetical protein
MPRATSTVRRTVNDQDAQPKVKLKLPRIDMMVTPNPRALRAC